MILTSSQKQILHNHLTHLLSRRAYPKTLCPSEVARALSDDELTELDAYSWRDTMEHIRALCWELREYGSVEILQKGVVVRAKAIDEIAGPIRVRYRKGLRREEMIEGDLWVERESGLDGRGW
ncbi:hypothetical protein BU23DRAFT_556073 [Bimuria novae-zelandiae CBS 107.79]|uniref:Uncharacterized protein n=1 Tax=Bimuria novae-zelandiae CBS 107.79 TaxID=1447943 RepID=A0A6A5V8C4_9PLEO|nr:hypothetical protein BU23DRAFT_556073 [Bimuria novae-zelandiae CBS 107.79]